MGEMAILKGIYVFVDATSQCGIYTIKQSSDLTRHDARVVSL